MEKKMKELLLGGKELRAKKTPRRIATPIPGAPEMRGKK